MLLSSGKDRDVIDRIASDDGLVRQPFFWSAPGMKLFGGHPDLKDPRKLRVIIDEAIAQQPSILVAFLQQACDKVYGSTGTEQATGRAAGEELAMLVQISLRALLAYVGHTNIDGPDIVSVAGSQPRDPTRRIRPAGPSEPQDPTRRIRTVKSDPQDPNREIRPAGTEP